MLRNSGLGYDPGDHWVTCDQGHTHWGRNGAAGMLLRHQDPHTGIARYFLQQRGPDVQHPGTWSTPGGAIEDGETPHAAAMREASEELGDFPAYNLNHMHTLDHGGWAYHTVTADVPHPFYPHGQNWDPNETSDAGWFTPHEIDELPLHPGFREGWDQYKPNQRPDPHREIWSKVADLYWHVAPTDLRETIQQERLQPNTHLWGDEEGRDQFHEEMEGPSDANWHQPHDVWNVNVDPTWAWRRDPNYDAELNARIVRRRIPPTNLELNYEQPWFRDESTHYKTVLPFTEWSPPVTSAAADTLWYNPGGHAWKDPHTRQWHQDWGRGILTPDQQMYTWPSDEMTHHERIMSLGLENRERGENTPVQFKIDPEGRVRTSDPGYWYNKAHPWIENQLTQYDPRLKATPFDPEIYGRNWDPETGEWAGRRSAASTLAWKPGQHGKGIVSPTGAVYKWSVWPDKDGDPSHSQVVSRMGYDRVPEMASQLHYFGITPTGGLRYVVDDSGENSPPEVIQQVANSLRSTNDQTTHQGTTMIPSLPTPHIPFAQGDTVNTPEGPGWIQAIDDSVGEGGGSLPVQVALSQGWTDWYHPSELQKMAELVSELPEQDGSTEPQEVANPEDHWPDWGQRPPDLPSGTHTDYDWALTRV